MRAYLDHAATTPLRPEARAAMEPVLDGVFGNPSGQHAAARAARRLLDDARDAVAAAVGAAPEAVVFTSGGTEADNLAVFGVTRAVGGAAVCSAVEHHAVLHPVEALGGLIAPVDADGLVDLDALDALLRSRADVAVVSIMAVNNETGVVQPTAEIAAVVRSAAPGASFHVDAVAAAPWFDLRPIVEAADLVTISGHKFGGPKGNGVLVVRPGTALAPLLLGGGQERERRSGTPDVAGAVGLAAALTATVAELHAAVARVGAARDRLVRGLFDALPDAVVTGAAVSCSPGIAHLRIPGIDREALLFLLDDDGIAASAGSSCASGALEPSHVLAAMGVPAAEAAGALRLSLGAATTDDEIDAALGAVPAAVARLGGRVTGAVA